MAKQQENLELIEQRGAVPVVVSSGDPVLDMIERVARDPTVQIERLQQLFDLKERHVKMQAEMAFNEAMQSAQEAMKPVVRDAQNSGNNSLYARLETIDKKIRPIYTSHGFSLSFNTGEPRDKDSVRVLCDVRHIAGHSKTYELEGALDMTGAKGTSNKTSIHGLGSSVSYLRRYLTIMIFNVVLTNEDIDGQLAASYITEDQQTVILDLLKECGLPKDSKPFLSFAGADCVEHIQKQSYDRTVQMLEKKKVRK